MITTTMTDQRMTRLVVTTGLLDEHPLVLIDVGASGGIQPHWGAFGDALKAFAFEPLVEESDRLNRATPSGKIQYYPYLISDKINKTPSSLQVLANRFSDRITPFGRSSALRAEQIIGQTSVERYNRNNRPNFSSEIITLDEFISKHSDVVSDVDFIKIDTDGSDFEVLLGAEETLNKYNVLGVAVEALFCDAPAGVQTPELFCPMHEFLRNHGFQLYDLIPYRYSRRHLPAGFYYDIPAQTVSGQVAWADCVYFKDPCTPDSSKHSAHSDLKLLKLACLYEAYRLSDCAAELILEYRDRLDALTNEQTGALLDALTPKLHGCTYTFQQYNEQFESNLQQFFNVGVEAAAISNELAYLRNELNYVLNSKTWKLTEPIRWLYRKCKDLLSVRS